MLDERGRQLTEAGPFYLVTILGFKMVLQLLVNLKFTRVKEAKSIANKREQLQRTTIRIRSITLDELGRII